MTSKISNLENIITENATKYYQGEPEISDYEFDSLVDSLRKIDPNNKLLSTPGWGYKPSRSHMKKINHELGEVGGLPKTNPDKISEVSDVSISISPKLDGASVVLYYDNNKLVRALTRGDGTTGLDITDKVLAIGIPPMTTFTGKFRRRGECVLPLDVWKDKYNSDKSARNIASGFLNRKEWSFDNAKDFMIVVYTTTDSNGKDLSDKSSDYMCERDNIKHVNRRDILTDSITEDVLKKYLNEDSVMYDHEILCDGYVAKLSDGTQIAIKWNKEGVRTVVKDIEWRQSQYGRFTPVLKIEPREISGAMVSNVSAANYFSVVDKGIGIGSEISVVRSGEIIPWVSEVHTKSDKLNIPEFCPVCGNKLEIDGVNVYCKKCPHVERMRIHTFVNSVCDIDGLGSSLIDKYLDYFVLSDLVSFLYFTRNYEKKDFENFVRSTQGTGDSSVRLLMKMKEKLFSKIPENKFLCGMGIQNFGITGINKALKENSIQQIIDKIIDGDKIDGVTIASRKSIYENIDNIKSVMKLVNVVRLDDKEDEIASVKICITGKLSKGRKEFVKEFKEFGVVEVSIANADYLVTNESDPNSSKGKEAKKRGIKIISEDEFRKLMNSR